MVDKRTCGEIWSRGFATGIPAVVLLFLVIALGLNNSPDSDNLPFSTANCSNLNLDFLNPNNIKISTNIFCGIFSGLTLFVMVYQIVVIVLKALQVGFLESRTNKKIFFWVDSILLNIFVAVFAAICAGVVFLSSYRNSYLTVFDNQLDGISTKHFGVTTGMLWAAFGFSISSMYQMISVLGHSWTTHGKCSKEENKEELKNMH
ncbi:PREDICTED: uncharacterized protein LOC100631518 [Amphimedon queenslandica]|uniref:Uncharacterized protein n=1 Tax=Amphimedon queenslandica TaxID=400682 RepID=A0A1X7VLG6_AMPQE|nr:PREDICTED: uncharacterized protein LOC100631518 [Amphimedon queenslandica]|eukprot:XP_003383799.2 PREDICTED: uncharacterized protein LOC100631518 [Amphimedon queenslandica]